MGAFIPEPLCLYGGLSIGAKAVYGRLLRYAGQNGQVYPAIATLGTQLGLSEKQARRYLRELEEGKFIEVDRAEKHYQRNGGGGTNRISFLWHKAFETPPPLPILVPPPPPKRAPPSPPQTGTQRVKDSRESVKENKPDYDCLPTRQKTLEVQSDPPGGKYLRENYPNTPEALRAHLGVDDPPSIVKTLKIIQAAGSPPEREILTAMENLRLRGYGGNYVRTYAYLETALADYFQQIADRREVSAPRGYADWEDRNEAIAQTARVFDFASRNGAL